MRIRNHEINITQMRKNGEYAKAYRKLKLREDILLVESQCGTGIQEEIFQVLRRVRQVKPELCIYVAAKKTYISQIRRKMQGGQNIKIIIRDGREYQKLLASAKWLLNDSFFPERFVKKAGQVYVKLAPDKQNWKFSGELREVLSHKENREWQRDSFQADYFIGMEEEAERLKDNPMLQNLSLTRLVKVDESKIKEKLQELFESGIISDTEEISFNEKENVILYLSALENNGITTSSLSLLSMIDLSRRNYVICYKDERDREVFQRLAILPETVGIMAMERIDFSMSELLAKILYYKCKCNFGFLQKKLERLYDREYRKCFAGIRVDTIVHYTGYESDIIRIIGKSNKKRVIYVHNDMEREIALKNYQHYETLRKAYQSYDKVVCVTEDIVPATKRIGGGLGHYIVCNNCHDAELVRRKAQQKIEFSKETESTHSVEQIKHILEEDTKKFITIGRYSPEKGHRMLLDAFADYLATGKQAYLFIIGGYGSMYQKMIEYVRERKLVQNVILIRNMRNPMPILKECDLFILSSLYEGLGLVILEAASLSIPVISTDIEGPRGFMQQYGGTLVEAGKEGILEGIRLYGEKRVKKLEIDFKNYNDKCVEQFESIFEE